MALQQTMTNADTGASYTDAYIRVKKAYAGDNGLYIEVGIYPSRTESVAGKKPLYCKDYLDSSYDKAIDDSGQPNIHSVAYLHLRSLSEYSSAANVIEP